MIYTLCTNITVMDEKSREFKNHVSSKNSVCIVKRIRSYHLNHSRLFEN